MNRFAAGQARLRLRLARLWRRRCLRKLHQTIRKITQDFAGRWHFNTCIAAVMELVNELTAAEPGLAAMPAEDSAQLMARHPAFAYLVAGPLRALPRGRALERNAAAPVHSCASRGRDSIQTWRGRKSWKCRCRSTASCARSSGLLPDADNEAMQQAALAEGKVQAAIAGKQVVKLVVVPGKLINIVVK